MNNFGNGFGITGVQHIVQGNGLLFSPNPITRNGVISLSPATAATITALSTKTQHITADGDRTQIDGTIVIHGPFLGQGDIGSSESPFDKVYAGNIITPSTNLNALATTVSNHTSSIIELQEIGGGVTAGAGIVCTPNPIVRTGIVSLSPTVAATIAETATTVQNIESTESTTSVAGSFRVVDVNLDPVIVIDPYASLVVHGSTVAVSNLQPISEGSTVGSIELPFNRVHAHTISTPQTDLNALGVMASNNTVAILALVGVTQNQSATPQSTLFTGPVTAAQFVKVGGASNQFLMADGSVSEGQVQNVAMDQDVVPLTMANAAVPANSYDYYIEDEMTRDITVRAIRVACSTVGSDSIRVAIYRFGTGKFILCGQSVATPASAVATIPIVAQIGQSLDFSKGESFVIGIAVGGTSTSLRGVTYTSNTSRYFFNTTDSVSTGFPTNPRVIGGGMSVMPCIRLIAF